jgi:hypothetical protein
MGRGFDSRRLHLEKGNTMSLRNTPPSIPHISVGDDGDRILTPFGPMIYQTFLSDGQVSTLLEEGNRLTMENDYAFKLAGNMRKGRSLQYSEEFRESFAPVIMDKVNRFVSGVSQVWGFGLPQTENLSLVDLWINYQRQYDFNPMHMHAHFMSFVIYCHIPEGIFDEQADSNHPVAGHISFNYGETMSPLSNYSYMVKPETNLMFLFPAKLHHIVYPFYAEGTRVSVSGNISCDYEL